MDGDWGTMPRPSATAIPLELAAEGQKSLEKFVLGLASMGNKFPQRILKRMRFA
jgi:hypothetical protein